VSKEIAELEAESESISAKIELRKKQFTLAIAAVRELQCLLDDGTEESSAVAGPTVEPEVVGPVAEPMDVVN
jgi:hypothetical protein